MLKMRTLVSDANISFQTFRPGETTKTSTVYYVESTPHVGIAMTEGQLRTSPPLGPPFRPPPGAFLVAPVDPEARLLDPFDARFFTPEKFLLKLPDPLRREALVFLTPGAFEPPRDAGARDLAAAFGTCGPSCVIRLLKAATSGSMCCVK
jgi:hypothetical protein